MRPCRRFRAELDSRLQECGYGRDADMFACYFYRREAGTSASGVAVAAVICASCDFPIGEHESTPRSPPTAVLGTAVTADGDAKRVTGDETGRDGLLSGRSASPLLCGSGDDEGPALPPGVVRNIVEGYDELVRDDGSWDHAWKLWLALGLVCTLAGVPGSIALIVLSTRPDASGGLALGGFIGGLVLLSFTVTLAALGLLLPTVDCIDTLRVSMPRTPSVAAGAQQQVGRPTDRTRCPSVAGASASSAAAATARRGDPPSLTEHSVNDDVVGVAVSRDGRTVWLELRADTPSTSFGWLWSSVTKGLVRADATVFTSNERDAAGEAAAAAWRRYLRPWAPHELQPPPRRQEWWRR